MKSEIQLALERRNLTLEQKYRLLREMEAAYVDYMEGRDANAIALIEQDVKMANAAIQTYAKLKSEVIDANGNISVARIQASAADLRNRRDTLARLLSSYGSAGKRIYDGVLRTAAQLNAGGQSASPAVRDNYIVDQLAMLDPSDPATHRAIDAYMQAKGLSSPPAALASAYNSSRGAWENAQIEMQSLEEIERFAGGDQSINPVQLKATLDFLAGVSPSVSFTAARAKVEDPEYAQKLTARIDSLQNEIDLLTAPSRDPGSWRFMGLNQEEASDILADPDFRTWAEARGFRLGMESDNGYILRPGDLAALRAASRERRGLPVLHTGKPEATLRDVQVLQERDVHPRFALDSSDKPKAGYIVQPDGSISQVDFTTGTATSVARRDERGQIVYTSPEARRAYNAFVEQHPPQYLAKADGSPFAISNYSSEGIRSIPFGELSPADTMPVRSYGTVRGRKLPPNIMDDPERTMRILTPDGEEHVLRKNDQGEWVGEAVIPRPAMRYAESAFTAKEAPEPQLREPVQRPDRQPFTERRQPLYGDVPDMAPSREGGKPPASAVPAATPPAPEGATPNPLARLRERVQSLRAKRSVPEVPAVPPVTQPPEAQPPVAQPEPAVQAPPAQPSPVVPPMPVSPPAAQAKTPAREGLKGLLDRLRSAASKPSAPPPVNPVGLPPRGPAEKKDNEAYYGKPGRPKPVPPSTPLEFEDASMVGDARFQRAMDNALRSPSGEVPEGVMSEQELSAMNAAGESIRASAKPSPFLSAARTANPTSVAGLSPAEVAALLRKSRKTGTKSLKK